MDRAAAVERVWSGGGVLPSVARAALAPFEGLYRAATLVRGALYDARLVAVRATTLPAVSVGNLTVGGTGKTPVAAWLAGELLSRGARPAVVLRGYGADEPLVHAALNPTVPVVTSADRLAGVARARAAGADVAVLDDAFQHRRAGRIADVVLVSADRWDGRTRLLPAGPWREPLSALRRASVALVTRKAAAAAVALGVLEALRQSAPTTPAALAHLALHELRRADGTIGEPHSGRLGLGALDGARILAVSAVGDPRAFHRQLEAYNARVTAAAYRDHYAFSPGDARELADRARRLDLVVCTLKDAVKLAPVWPREGPPLWYVSQRLTIERGRDDLDGVIRAVLGARAPSSRPL